MVSRREREKEERRKYILDKAQILFAEKGFLGTSMAEIAAASEFAVGSLYSFFNSKEEILTTIFEYHIEHLISEVTRVRDDNAMTAQEKIGIALEKLVKLYVDNQDFFRIYVAEARGVEWGIRTEVGEYIYNGTVRFVSVLSDIFKLGMDEGVVDPDVDPEFLALLLRSYVHSSVVHFLYGKRGVKIEDLLIAVKRFLFFGISPLRKEGTALEEMVLFEKESD